jgi:hypothetical protein
MRLWPMTVASARIDPTQGSPAAAKPSADGRIRFRKAAMSKKPKKEKVLADRVPGWREMVAR